MDRINAVQHIFSPLCHSLYILYSESGNNGIGICPIYTDFWEERLEIDGSGYRGSLNFIKDGSGIAVINVVNMDQ